MNIYSHNCLIFNIISLLYFVSNNLSANVFRPYQDKRRKSVLSLMKERNQAMVLYVCELAKTQQQFYVRTHCITRKERSSRDYSNGLCPLLLRSFSNFAHSVRIWRFLSRNLCASSSRPNWRGSWRCINKHGFKYIGRNHSNFFVLENKMHFFQFFLPKYLQIWEKSRIFAVEIKSIVVK